MPRSTERYDLLHTRLERFTRLLHVLEDGDVLAVHRTRVASRRLREVIPVLQLDAGVTEKLSRRLRKVTKRLGRVRELDVLWGMIDDLTEVARYPKTALARVAVNQGKDRGDERGHLLAKVPVTELRRLAAKLEKLARTLQTEDAAAPGRRTAQRSWQWAIDARIARRASALRTVMADAGGLYLSERLHAVRIAVKKLRYALELSAEVAHIKSSPHLRQLRRVQTVLGRLHDLQVLIERAREAQASLMPPDVAAWRELDALVVALEDDCRRLHARYIHERDGLETLCARLTAPREREAKRNLEVRNQKVKVARI